MTSLTQDIRGALQQQVENVTGFPPAAQRAYEGKTFTPTVGIAWARLTLMTNSRRPFSLSGVSKITGGIFLIDLFYPPGSGTATIDAMADAVVDAYAPEAPLIQGSTRVLINYAQRAEVMRAAEDLQVPITVSWRVLPS